MSEKDISLGFKQSGLLKMDPQKLYVYILLGNLNDLKKYLQMVEVSDMQKYILKLYYVLMTKPLIFNNIFCFLFVLLPVLISLFKNIQIIPNEQFFKICHKPQSTSIHPFISIRRYQFVIFYKMLNKAFKKYFQSDQIQPIVSHPQIEQLHYEIINSTYNRDQPKKQIIEKQQYNINDISHSSQPKDEKTHSQNLLQLKQAIKALSEEQFSIFQKYISNVNENIRPCLQIIKNKMLFSFNRQNEATQSDFNKLNTDKNQFKLLFNKNTSIYEEIINNINNQKQIKKNHVLNDLFLDLITKIQKYAQITIKKEHLNKFENDKKISKQIEQFVCSQFQLLLKLQKNILNQRNQHQLQLKKLQKKYDQQILKKLRQCKLQKNQSLNVEPYINQQIQLQIKRNLQQIQKLKEQKEKENKKLTKAQQQASLQKKKVQQIYEKESRHLFAGEMFLEEDSKQKEYLVNKLREKLNKKIKRTKMVFKLDPLNSVSEHKYIDDLPNIVALVRTQNGYLSAFYLEKPISKEIQIGQCFILSLTNEKYFPIAPDKKAATYDDFYIIIGNSEIRFKTNDRRIYSNLGVTNGLFRSQGQNAGVLFGSFPRENIRQTILQYIEIYQLIFY